MAQWPKASVPKGAFEDIEQVVGRVSVSKMVTGTPILAAELAAPNSGAGLVALIKPGMRAMAIKVKKSSVSADSFYRILFSKFCSRD